MSGRTMHVSDVKVGLRFRKDLGSVDDLVESIREVGLIHPIVVDTNGNLIAGERRLIACQRLGMTEITVTVVDLDVDRLRVEMDENTVRKSFTPTEMVAIKKAIEDNLRTPVGRPSKSAKITHVPQGRTTSKVAELVGVSDRTLEKAEAVVDAAAADPSLTPVVEEMDRTGKVDPAYRRVREPPPDPAAGDVGDLVYARRSRKTLTPAVFFAKMLISLRSEVEFGATFDVSGVTPTPGQVEALNDVISKLIDLRDTVQKNMVAADPECGEGKLLRQDSS